MANFQVLIFFALLCSFVTSSPISKVQKRSFKIPLIRRDDYQPNGRYAVRKALFKFGFNDISFVPNSDIAKQISAATLASINGTGVSSDGTEDGEVQTNPTQNDAEFVSPVTVGGQLLVMNFDSGSSDMWVFNTQLSAASQRGHDVYDPTKSKTFSAMRGATFNISYGDGSFASGSVGVDSVDIGGATVDQQAIGLPNNVATSFIQDRASNGLVGLAFSQLNTVKPTKQKTFFDNVIGDLTQPVFTARLKHGAAGAYEFGNIDTSAFTGKLNTVPVDSSKGFWEFDSQSAAVNGQTINVPGGKAIADTGTSLMLVADDILVGYWNQVDGAQVSQQAGGVIFPCNTNLPDLQIAVGNSYMATVSGSLMNFAKVGQDTNTGNNFCFGGLQSNAGLGFSIYGDVFFKSQFVVFDGSGPSLGVAPHA